MGTGKRKAVADHDITESELRRHIEVLAGDIGERNVFRPRALQAAAEYIEQEWTRQGHAVSVQGYEARGVPSRNIEITLAGRTRPEEIILIGAHYDTVRGGPGANDNGSGVAALLAIGRSMAGLVPFVWSPSSMKKRRSFSGERWAVWFMRVPRGHALTISV